MPFARAALVAVALALSAPADAQLIRERAYFLAAPLCPEVWCGASATLMARHAAQRLGFDLSKTEVISGQTTIPWLGERIRGRGFAKGMRRGDLLIIYLVGGGEQEAAQAERWLNGGVRPPGVDGPTLVLFDGTFAKAPADLTPAGDLAALSLWPAGRAPRAKVAGAARDAIQVCGRLCRAAVAGVGPLAHGAVRWIDRLERLLTEGPDTLDLGAVVKALGEPSWVRSAGDPGDLAVTYRTLTVVIRGDGGAISRGHARKLRRYVEYGLHRHPAGIAVKADPKAATGRVIDCPVSSHPGGFRVRCASVGVDLKLKRGGWKEAVGPAFDEVLERHGPIGGAARITSHLPASERVDVTVDGRPWARAVDRKVPGRPLGPGSHRFVCRADGEVVRGRFFVERGREVVVTCGFPLRESENIAFWSMLTTGAVAAGVGVAFILLFEQAKQDVRPGEPIKTPHPVLGWSLIGAGAAAMSASGLLWGVGP